MHRLNGHHLINNIKLPMLPAWLAGRQDPSDARTPRCLSSVATAAERNSRVAQADAMLEDGCGVFFHRQIVDLMWTITLSKYVKSDFKYSGNIQ